MYNELVNNELMWYLSTLHSTLRIVCIDIVIQY